MLPKLPENAAWHALYRDHEAITRGLGNAFPGSWGMDGDIFLELLNEYRDINRRELNNPGEVASELLRLAKPQKIMQIMRINYRQAERDYKRHLIDIYSYLRDQEHDDETTQFDAALRSEPAVYFFARLVLPAVVLWQITPQGLLRQARSAKSPQKRAEAVERLVRLDPLAIHLPEIIDWQNVADGYNRAERQRQILAWRLGGLDHGKFSRPAYKAAIGSLVQATAMRIGRYLDRDGNWHDVTMTAHQVKELFHAAARDGAGRYRGVFDEDIEEMQAASWSRRLRRYRPLWEQLIPEIPGSKSSGLESGAR